MSFDENTKINTGENLIQTDVIDEPLIIVLDDDDDYSNDFAGFDLTKTKSDDSSPDQNEQLMIVSNETSSKDDQVKNFVDSLPIDSTNKVKVFHRSSKTPDELENPDKYIRTIVVDTSFKRPTNNQRQRTKSLSKRKNMSSSNHRKNLSIDDHSFGSIQSFISFDKSSDILTISRMGSIYYCVEDLYIKEFSSLCTLEEFTNFLIKSETIIFKQVTLSEKLSIEQRCPKLKKLNHIRYRLISINSSDYLIKLKQLLIANKKEKRVEKVVNEIRSYKKTSTPVLSNKKVSSPPAKRMSTDDEDDDDERHKRLKIVTNEPTESDDLTQYDDFLIDSTSPTNEKSSSPTTSKSILIEEENNNEDFQFQQSPSNNSRQCSFSSNQFEQSNFNLLSTPFPLRRLQRSRSLIFNRKQTKEISTRSLSLPPIKFNLKQNIMLTLQPTGTDSIGDNYSMPMIVNVEENVEGNQCFNQHLAYSRDPFISQMSNPMVSTEPYNPIPYSYYRRPPAYNLYQREPSPLSSSYTISHESSFNYHNPSPNNNSNSNTFSSINKPFFQNPNFSHSVTSNQQIPSIPCHLPCCSRQSSISETCLSNSQASTSISPNERMIYPQYTKCIERPKNRKQRQIETNPYSPPKTPINPLSIPYSHPQNRSINPQSRKANVHHPIPPVVLQNSSTLISPPNTPNELSLPNICTRSIDLSQAIILHGHCDIDKIPKLVVRHTKNYSSKTIATMGQLFPLWFNEPDYRCIHCFTCDQVFTPQQFMLHVDDEQIAHEQIIKMTSIQLLTSEKMSEKKVGLWNQFCTALTIYASKFAEAEKKKIVIDSLKGRPNNWIRIENKFMKDRNEEKPCATPSVPVISTLTVTEHI